MQNFTISPVTDPEIFTFTITGANEGYAMLNRMEINWTAYYNQMYNQSNNTNKSNGSNTNQSFLYVSYSINITYNISAEELQAKLKNITDFGKYDPRVTR